MNEKRITDEPKLIISSNAVKGSILDRLKPSNKNKMITKKFGNLLSNSPVKNKRNNSDNNIHESSIQNDFFLLKKQITDNQYSEDNLDNLNFNNYKYSDNNIFNFGNQKNLNYFNSPIKPNGESSSELYNNLNYFNTSTLINNNNKNNNFQNNPQKNLSKFEKMIQNTSELRNSTATLQTNANQISNTSLKWSNMVKKSKQEMLKLDLSQSEVLSSTNQLDFSAMSENMDDLNDLIEENYQVVITENLFLRQETHSILPFLFLSSREIHRMCLSDYEIKLVNKSFKDKIKNNRLDWMDYYKRGLIKFYQAKYFESYMNFKAASNMRGKDKEVGKWLAFNILIIIFCANYEANSENSNFSNSNEFTNNFLNFNLGNNKKNSLTKNYNNNNEDANTNDFYCNSNNTNYQNKITENANYCFNNSFKIDFSNMNKITIKNENFDYNNSASLNQNNINSDDEDNNLFSCCSSRKTKIKSIQLTSLVNAYQADRDHNTKFNKNWLCRELEKTLKELLELSTVENTKSNSFDNAENNCDFLTKENAYIIEIWWMIMIVSVYAKLKPDQKAFGKIYDPKHCVKKIKDKDVYLGYLAYAEYNNLIDKNFNPENIYVEIIYKYPKRIEGYLKFWSRLVKSKPKEYKKAHSLSEVFWKNSSIIQFDNDVY